MIEPGTGALIFLIGGVGTLATFTAYNIAERVGPSLTINDLRPAAPWEGLPVPVFFYTKPELLSDLGRK